MWLFTTDGFVSLVQHRDDPMKIRARARRAEHLTETFGVPPELIIDYGPDAHDYRYHADVDRAVVAEALLEALARLDYTSHAKEAIAGDDQQFYWSLLTCWRELFTLQV